MKFIVLFFVWTFMGSASGQLIDYTPNRKLALTLPKTYYSTEYIYLKNISSEALSLKFELIENTLNENWSATLCTNLQCLNYIPEHGNLGSISPGEEARFSLNLSANNTIGDGQLRFLISSPKSQELSDTVTYHFIINEDGKIKPQDWVKVNYSNGILNVLLQNSNEETTLNVFDLKGTPVYTGTLSSISSIPLGDYAKGIYFVVVSDTHGKTLKKKIMNY